MAFYADEEEVWKCPKHPLKRRRTGICPTCLRERLVTLCPECANTRPCSCSPAPADSTSTSSSSSSSFSRFQFSRGGSGSCRRDGFFSSAAGGGEVGRVSNLIESEPAFRKSRSLAVPSFLRSRSKYVDDRFDRETEPLPRVSRSRINFWSVFKVSKTRKCDLHDDDSNQSVVSGATEDYSRMMRSRSVAVPATSKRRGWYFPSPIKAFRQSKTSKLQPNERSPMPPHRG